MKRVLLIPLLIVLAACGAANSGSPTKGSTSTQDQWVAYARCLRGQGVDAPDPQPGQPLKISGQGVSKEKLDAAMQACKQHNPKDGGTETAADRDRALKIAQCMRKKGINVADPEPGQPISIEGGAGQDPQKVEQARQECRQEIG